VVRELSAGLLRALARFTPLRFDLPLQLTAHSQ
jgi:hypothetical protein